MFSVIAPMGRVLSGDQGGSAFAPSLRFAGARTLLGGLTLPLGLVLRREPLWPEARLVRWILPLGVLATTLTFGAMFASPAYTGAGIASVLGNTQPLIIIVLAAMLLSEQIKLGKALALLLGLAGVTLLALPALRGQTWQNLLGATLSLGSWASAATANVAEKRLHPGKVLMSLTEWQLVAGSVVLLGLSAVIEPRGTTEWTGGFVGLLLFLALAGTALSTWLWYWLLQRTEAGHLLLYLFLVPVFGLLIAMTGFGERLNAWQADSVALILLAVAVSAFGGWSGTARRINLADGKPPTEAPQRKNIDLNRPCEAITRGVQPAYWAATLLFMNESKSVTTDPICGMPVDETTALHAERDGQAFYFCGEDCRRKFSPKRLLSKRTVIIAAASRSMGITSTPHAAMNTKGQR